MKDDWSPERYLEFADFRTRPAADLLAAVPNGDARVVVDLGCGPGNSTELLVARFPDARVSGMDSSGEMIAAARRRLPGCDFTQAKVEEWTPVEAPDLLFANAVLQWLPDHARLLPRLVESLNPGGSLAVQMPDNLDEPSHVAMREAAADSRWRARMGEADAERTGIETPHAYYRMLKPLCRRVEVWHTIYNHPLAGGLQGIVDWFSGTGLLPYLSRLDPAGREAYLDVYRAALEPHYPVLDDGTVLLAFPRIFIVATR